MCLAQDNDVVHTFTPDRSDQPFDKKYRCLSVKLQQASHMIMVAAAGDFPEELEIQEAPSHSEGCHPFKADG